MIGLDFNLPPEEAIKYLKNKGYKLFDISCNFVPKLRGAKIYQFLRLSLAFAVAQMNQIHLRRLRAPAASDGFLAVS